MTRTRLIFLFLLASCFLGISTEVFALRLEGVVLSVSGPVNDAVVTAYPDYASFLAQENGIRSTSGEKPGQYSITLPNGKYYLIAQGSEQGKALFGYHGLNPINLDGEYRWVPLIALPVKKAQCEPGFQGVGGQVVYKGEPVDGSSISVYALEDEPFRGMGLLTNTVPEDGSFWFDLDPGRYVVVARKRHSGGAIGPIKKGDLLCYYSNNPIHVLPGQSCMVDVACYPRDDLDGFLVKEATDPRGRKAEARRQASLREVDETDSTRLIDAQGGIPAVISGRVTDSAGTPLAKLYISAYPADEVQLFQMYVLRTETKHMTRTNDKGFFRLELGSGVYYLVARQRLGDAPIAGEYYGIYEGTPNHSIVLGPNEIKTGVHIIADSIMP